MKKFLYQKFQSRKFWVALLAIATLIATSAGASVPEEIVSAAKWTVLAWIGIEGYVDAKRE